MLMYVCVTGGKDNGRVFDCHQDQLINLEHVICIRPFAYDTEVTRYWLGERNNTTSIVTFITGLDLYVSISVQELHELMRKDIAKWHL